MYGITINLRNLINTLTKHIMKKVFRRTSLLLAAILMGSTSIQAQKSPQDMDRFIDALMKKMTVEEKIGQLNLPVTGEITTGQAKSSDVAKKIEQGLVGGLFNLKGVAKIRDVQNLAVETGHPAAVRYGRDTWLRNHIPHSVRVILHMGYESHSEVGTHCSCRGKCRRYILDIQPDGGHQPGSALGTCQRR